MLEGSSNITCFSTMTGPRFSVVQFLCTTVLVPGGANGVVLKLKLPKNAAYADNEGFRLDDRNKFTVRLRWGRSRSHLLEGNFGSHVYNPVIK